MKIAYIRNYNYQPFVINSVDAIVYNYSDLDSVEWSLKFDIILIAKTNIKRTEKLITAVKQYFQGVIYLVINDYDDDILSLIFKHEIRDFILTPINSQYLLYKIQFDYKIFKKNLIFKYRDLKIDYLKQSVTINNEFINLTNKEYQVLITLTRMANRTLSKEYIIDEVWHYSTTDYRSLETHIKTLRKKLGDYGRQIITITSRGYCFVDGVNNFV